MIIRLKGATFTTNIGTLDSWSIKYTATNGSVTKKSGDTSIKKDDTDGEILVFEFDTAKYTYKSGTIVSNDVSAGTISVSGNTITVNVNAGSTLGGKVEINFVMEAIGGGKPDTPATPTSYTFTINPTPTSATVTLSATGYSTVSGTGSKSITVANGTKVNWTVSASGYTTRTGNWTANGKDETLPVVLTATGGGGTGGDTSNLLTENPYFVTTGIPTQATNSSYGTKIGYDYGGFICKGIKSASTGKGNSFNVYTGTKGSDGYIGNTEQVETFTYTKEKGIEEEFLFNSPIDLTGDTRLTCNGSFLWRQATTEEQNNPPQGVGRLQTNTPLYYYWYIFQ